jgi:branched-chain amino acid aminotransferase
VANTAPLSQRSDMVVFLNGEFVPAHEARVGVMTHALSYGTGVFEGIRGYYNPEVGETYLFRLREHYERLHRSARVMQIKLPYTVDQLIQMSVELVRRNGFHENCYLKPVAYKTDEVIGVQLHGVHDGFYMLAVPMGDYVKTDGMRCGVSSWRRIDDNMIPARAKVTGAYVNSAFAKSEAKQNGFDEAIMLTSEGHVSEGSAENIFLLLNNELITPPPSENILVGVTRDTIMELARREMDRAVRERVVDRTELYVADEIFLTGTGAQIAPVVEVDHRPIGSGKVGPLAAAMQRIYHEVVRGMRPEYMSWCSAVFGATAATQATTFRPVAAAAGHNGHSNGHNGHANGRVKQGKPAARGKTGRQPAGAAKSK